MPLFRRKGYSRFDLARDLRTAGIHEGDILVVHSALSKVGWVLGGPQEVIHALQDVLGPAGTLVMPTFSFSLAGWQLPPFDPWKTASRVGILTDTFWRQRDVLRSHHPTHSVAAWGCHAHEFIDGPLSYGPLGTGSPLDRVREAGGRILLLGVGQNRNSTVHLAEARAEMPYLSVCFTIDADYDEAWYRDEPGGEAKFLPIREMPGSSEGFELLDDLLVDLGVSTRVVVGEAPCQLMQSERLCAVVEEMLRGNPFLFLRATEPCEITKEGRAYIESLLTRRSETG